MPLATDRQNLRVLEVRYIVNHASQIDCDHLHNHGSTPSRVASQHQLSCTVQLTYNHRNAQHTCKTIHDAAIITVQPLQVAVGLNVGSVKVLEALAMMDQASDFSGAGLSSPNFTYSTNISSSI
jgi:hypothetical protein